MSARILSFPRGRVPSTYFVDCLTIVMRFQDGTEVLMTPITTRNRGTLRQVAEWLIDAADELDSNASNPTSGEP